MIIDDFNFVSVPISPPKTNSPPVIDSNAVLASTITLECFQPIPGRHAEVIKTLGRVQLNKLPQHHPVKIRRKAAARCAGEETLGLAVGEASNHPQA